MHEVTISQWDKLSKKDKKNVNKIIFPGTKKIANVKDRPTMAFATMCKNEEHCLGKTLDCVKDYVDYVVVADNGSTDGTFDIVRNYFKDTGIPGAWHIDKWYGFDKNKTLMMSYVKDKTDYVIHLDADDFFQGNFKFDFVDVGKDCYRIVNKRGGSNYKCSIIYDNRLTWRFCGVAHTIIKASERPNAMSIGEFTEEVAWIDNAGTGARALDPEKFLGDAKRLSKQYWDTLINDPDNLNSRSVFYCAQSYLDQGGKYIVNSLQWYKKYLTLRNTWFEEEYESLLSIARIKLALNNLPEYEYKFTFEEIEQDFLTAINTCNGRAEAYHRLGKLYNQNKMFNKSYDILSKAKKINIQEAKDTYSLFIIDHEYGDWNNDELSVACYWLGKTEEGIKLIEDVINEPSHSWQRDHYQRNLEHFKNI